MCVCVRACVCACACVCVCVCVRGGRGKGNASFLQTPIQGNLEFDNENVKNISWSIADNTIIL